jgi:RecB family exonuclease
MVKIFYMPFSAENAAELLFKEAIRHIQHLDYSKIIYLAPSPVKVKEANKIFHQLVTRHLSLATNKCYIPPEMAAISQYCKGVYSIYGSRRIVNRTLIPLIISYLSGKGIGFSSLIADLIHDLKKTYPGRDAGSLKSDFDAIFSEMDIPDTVAEAVMSCLEIFQQYQLLMEGNGLIDDDDVVNFVSDLLAPQKVCDTTTPQNLAILGGPRFFGTPIQKYGGMKTPEIYYSTAILDGFYDPAISEKMFLKSFISVSENTLISVPYDSVFETVVGEYINFLKENFVVEEIYPGDDSGIGITKKPQTFWGATGIESKFTYCSYPSIEEEAEGICRSIKSLYISGKHKELEDIIVAFPLLRKYSAIVNRVFKRYGIPCSIFKKEPLGKTAPFLDLLCMLDSVAEDYPRLKFSQFLSSYYFAKIPEGIKKWIPSLSLCSGVIAGKTAWLNFISGGSEIIDTELLKEKDALEKGMRWVFKKLQPLENIKNGAALDAYVRLIMNIIDDFGFLAADYSADYNDSGDDDNKDFFIKNIRKAAKEVFEQLLFISDLKKSQVKLTDFIDTMRHILNASYIESSETGVRIMDFIDAAGLSASNIYLGGLTDEDMPSKTGTKTGIDYLLPDNVKKRMNLLSLEKHLNIQRFNFYRLIGLSSGGTKLHLSYPLSEGDDMFLPSSFLYFGEETKKNLPGIFSKEEYLLNIGLKKGTTKFLSSISEIDGIRSSTFNRKMHAFIPVTDIDAYRTCPRKFFIEKVLRLMPSEIKEYDIEASTIGKIIHRIMERIIKEPFDDLEYLKHKAKAIAEDAMRDKKIDNYWKKIISDAFIEILPDIYEKEVEIRRDGYAPARIEMKVNGEPIKGIRLTGKIDRVDMLGDSVRIIDYKTGSTSLNCKQVLEGNENLQLFLYAAVLKNLGYKINKVGLYSLKDINVKWCPPKKSRSQKTEDGRQKTDSIYDYIAASLKFLEETVRDMRKGNFRAMPLKDYICWNCHEYAFCPYIQQ